MARDNPGTAKADQKANDDRELTLTIDGKTVVGIGSFHKSLKHDEYGEVDATQFGQLVDATTKLTGFEAIGKGDPRRPGEGVAQLTNPSAGLAADRLTHEPHSYAMPPAPPVLSDATAAEYVELCWMAMLRDVPFNAFEQHPDVAKAAADVNAAVAHGIDTGGSDPLKLRPGIDLPGSPGAPAPFTPANLFRLGLPGEEVGPMLSQFFMRPIAYGAQTIDPRVHPYKAGRDYLTRFNDWLAAQNSGKDDNDQAYSGSNEDSTDYYEPGTRYISTMRDLARFVNKDALHQAYFNAALLLLSGGARWTPGNPFAEVDKKGRPVKREAGFGVLGGPHILALVSEVATRALKVVWFQKWMAHLRLRPEAYGGLAHVQKLGNEKGDRRAYGLPEWLFDSKAARRIAKCAMQQDEKPSYLLPIAFTAGSPTHPAYGAGHATVAGACVTVLKAWFAMEEPDREDPDKLVPIPFSRLLERDGPAGEKHAMLAYVTGEQNGVWDRFPLSGYDARHLTIEGELNKLAQNVGMGRSMGGVHWRSDNARSLILGEALAAEMLCDITRDVMLKDGLTALKFTFRSFARKADGQPKRVEITGGTITVDGVTKTTPLSEL